MMRRRTELTNLVAALSLMAALGLGACAEDNNSDNTGETGNNEVNNDQNNDTNNDTPECGDGVCDEGETAESCAQDCQDDVNNDVPECGDGVCDDGEDEDSCPDDCAPVTGCDPPCADGEECVEDVCVPIVMDGDEDGVPDEDDNCPTDQNEDQSDRDGDGIGDVCDACPDDNDPENDPEVCAPIFEMEPNNDVIQGEQGWELPLRVEGNIAAPEGNVADQDFFSFRIEQGKALRIRLTAQGDNFWAAMLMLGYDFTNQDYIRVLFTPDLGAEETREIFITRPGRFSFIVSDLRNLIVNPQNLGGPDFNYQMEITEFELTEIEELPGLPFNDLVQFDNRLRVWSFPAGDQAFVNAEASGQSFDQNALIRPTISIFDPENNTILAESLDTQVDEDQNVSFRSLTPGDGRLWFILDPSQAFGPNATSVTLTPGNTDGGEEEPNNSFEEAFPMEVPGDIAGRINLPTPDPNTNRLLPDEDFFVFSASAGDFLTFELTKAEPDNDFDAFLSIGEIDRFNRFDVLATNDNIEPEGANTNARLDFLVPETGIYYVRVEDEANNSIGPDEDPVGGLAHAYTLSATAADINVIEDLTPPATAEGSIPGPGQQAFYTVTAEPGLAVVLSANTTGGTAPFLRAYDGESRALIGQDDFGNAFTALIPESGSLLVQVGDRNGRGGPEFTFEFNVAERQIETIEELPFVEEGVLAVADEADLFIFSAEADVLYDIRVDQSNSSISLAEIALFDADNLSVSFANTFSRTILVRFDEPREVAIRIRDINNNGGDNFIYRLAVDEVVPESFDALPVEVTAEPAESGDATYFTVPFSTGQRLLAQLSAEGDVTAQATFYNFDTLQQLRSTTEAQFAFTRNADLTLLVAIHDNQNRGVEGASIDFTLDLLDPQEVEVPFSEEVTLTFAGDKRFYEFDAPAGSMVDVLIDLPEDSPVNPRLTLYRADTLGFLGQAFGNTRLEEFSADGGRMLLEVSDLNRSVDVSFTVNINSSIPTDITFPAIVEGALPESGQSVYYRLTATSGELIAASVDFENGDFLPVLSWFVAEGFESDSNPEALFFAAPRDGTYIFSVRDAQGRGGEDFAYTLNITLVNDDTLQARDEAEPNNAFEENTAIIDALPARISGTLLRNGDEPDRDIFPIDLVAGDKISALTTFGLSELSTDTILELYDPEQTQLARDDDGGEGSFSNLGTFEAPVDGTYFVVVTPFGSNEGDYSLIVNVQ